MHFHFAIGHNNKYVGTVRYPDVQNWKKHVQCNNVGSTCSMFHVRVLLSQFAFVKDIYD